MEFLQVILKQPPFSDLYNNLYNKQDKHIYIYVDYSRPNDWTDWAEIFFGHSWVAGRNKG